jgi:hypothetical protein
VARDALRAVEVQNDERDEWFCYEVCPLMEKRQRQNILAVIELSPPVVFLRLQAGRRGRSATEPVAAGAAARRHGKARDF